MTDTVIGHGAALQRSSDGTSGGVFSSVGEIIDLTPPGMSRDAVEVTHMASTEKWREFKGGLKDGGEVSFDMNFDPGDAATTAFLSDLNTDTAGYYKIIFPDDGATEWGFAAIATGYEPQNPIDDRMVATFTMKLTGKPTYVA